MSVISDLSKLRNTFRPEGGFGLNLGALEDIARQQGLETARRSTKETGLALDRSGLGRSVYKAGLGNVNTQLAGRDQFRTMADLRFKNQQLQNQSDLGLLGLLAPVAQSMQGPGLGEILGALLGAGTQLGAAYLGRPA